MTTVIDHPRRGHRTIRLALAEADYARFFGRDAMFWYRLEQSLGRFSVVGATVKAPERLPHQDLVADEKHSRLDGEKIHIATTAGEGCILGAFWGRRSPVRPRRRRCGKPMGCLPRKRTLPDSPMKRHTLDLCTKRAQFSRSYDHARAHRTSNLL